jgi:hypothetical protein
MDYEKALKTKKYREEDFRSAIRGEKVPQFLGFQVTRNCVVRGIRYHPGFALDLQGSCGQFTRALNARAIMSNKIPDMVVVNAAKSHPDSAEFPYCIWHPEVATEATYRNLASRYPQMRYHVGRAYAVAGYTDLYWELDL